MTKQIATVLADALGSVALLLATRYLSPADAQFAKEFIAIMQPVVGVLLAGMFYADKAALEARTKESIAAMTVAMPPPNPVLPQNVRR